MSFSFSVNDKDLELVAHFGEGKEVANERINQLTNRVAVSALQELANEKIRTSKIEYSFYQKIINGVYKINDILYYAILDIPEQNKKLVEIIKEKKTSWVCPEIEQLLKLECHEDENAEQFLVDVQRLRIAIAKFYVEKLNYQAFAFLSDFDVKGRRDLHDIVRVATIKAENEELANFYQLMVFQCGWDLSKCQEFQDLSVLEFKGDIDEFSKKSQILRAAFAKFCAQHAPQRTIDHIHFLGIENEKDRLDIAHILARLVPRLLAGNIGYFMIGSEKDRLALAKICVRDSSVPVAAMQNFEIKDPEAFLELVKLCAQQDAVRTASLILDHTFVLNKNADSMVIYCLKRDYKVFRCFQGSATTFDLTLCLEMIKKFLAQKKIACPEFLLPILTPVVKGANETDKNFARRKERQAQTLEMFAAALSLMDLDQVKTFLKSPILPAIEALPRPDLKWRLIVQAIAAVKETPLSLTTSKKQTPWKHILTAILTQCCAHGFPLDQAPKILGLSEHSFFKDGKHHQPLLEALLMLAENEDLNESTQQNLVARLLDPTEFESGQATSDQARAFSRQIGLLLALLAMNHTAIYSDPAKKTLEAMVQASFEQLLPLRTIADFGNKYLETFGASRAPYAIMIYAAKLKLLNDPRVLNDLAKFVELVLSGKSIEARHTIADNPHLKKIHETHPQVIEKWFQKLPSIRLSTLEKEEKTAFSYHDWCVQKLITDQHLPALEEKEPFLFYHLTGSTKSASSSQLSNLALQLMEAKEGTIILSLLQQMVQLPNIKGTEFEHDLQGKIASFQHKAPQQMEEVVVMETEDPIDLLVLGTEVPGSCQRIEGDPALNKGLLGYLLDGKIRALVIKSKEGPDGKILGRALLKLMWDGEKPVLYLERFYLNEPSSLYENALIELAERKAKILGLELVAEKGKGKQYEKPLQSLGGPAVFEYSDASAGVYLNGQYAVTSAYRLKP